MSYSPSPEYWPSTKASADSAVDPHYWDLCPFRLVKVSVLNGSTVKFMRVRITLTRCALSMSRRLPRPRECVHATGVLGGADGGPAHLQRHQCVRGEGVAQVPEQFLLAHGKVAPEVELWLYNITFVIHSSLGL